MEDSVPAQDSAQVDQSIEGSSSDGSQNNSSPTNDWLSSVPEEYREKLGKFNSPLEVVKSYVNLESLIGKKFSDFTAQDKEAFATIYGSENFIPDSPDKYQFNITVADGQENLLTDVDVKVLSDGFIKNKFTNNQAQHVIDILNDAGNVIVQQLNAQRQEIDNQRVEVLQKSWGNAWKAKLDDVNTCIEKVLPSMINYTPEQLKAELKAAGPATMEAYAALGSLMRDRGTGYNNFSPNDATVSLNHLKSDPEMEKIIANRHHPRHSEVMNRIATLSKLKHGEM